MTNTAVPAPLLASAAPSTARSICLDCRTVVGHGERCPGGRRHRVTSLATREGRERLVNEVWGPPHLRRKLKEAAVAGGSGGLGGGIVESCGLGDCVDCGASGDGTVILVVLASALAAVLIYWLVKALVGVYRARKNRPRPKGAWTKPAPPAGQVRSGRLLPSVSAASGVPLARGLQLDCERFAGSAVMLRDGTCQELMIQLDDGARVRIPAGRLRIEAAPSFARPVSAKWLADYLARLDPLRETSLADAHADPIPCDRAGEVTLEPGDRVTFQGELDWEEDPRQPGGGYRAAAAMIGVPRGPCALRLIERAAQ